MCPFLCCFWSYGSFLEWPFSQYWYTTSFTVHNYTFVPTLPITYRWMWAYPGTQKFPLVMKAFGCPGLFQDFYVIQARWGVPCMTLIWENTNNYFHFNRQKNSKCSVWINVRQWDRRLNMFLNSVCKYVVSTVYVRHFPNRIYFTLIPIQLFQEEPYFRWQCCMQSIE